MDAFDVLGFIFGTMIFGALVWFKVVWIDRPSGVQLLVRQRV